MAGNPLPARKHSTLAPGRDELAGLRYAVVDLETTGWSPRRNAITEIGVVLGRGRGREGEFSSLVRAGQPVPPAITELTGISDSLLAAAPRLDQALPALLRFTAGRVLVAHNAGFDVSFLKAACAASGLPWPGPPVLDTVLLARQLVPADRVPDRKLATLARYFGTRDRPAHRALADARATAEVLGELLWLLRDRGIRTLAGVLALPGLTERERPGPPPGNDQGHGTGRTRDRVALA